MFHMIIIFRNRSQATLHENLSYSPSQAKPASGFLRLALQITIHHKLVFWCALVVATMALLKVTLACLLLPSAVFSTVTVGLPLETFQSLLNSDLDHLSQEDAIKSYDTEQRRALLQSSNSKYPCLICNSGNGLNGYDRRKVLQRLIKEKALVVNNKEEMSCFFAPLVSHQIAKLDESDFEYIIQPLSGSMRIKKGTVDTIKGYSENDEKTLGVVLCEPDEAADRYVIFRSWVSFRVSHLTSNVLLLALQ